MLKYLKSKELIDILNSDKDNLFSKILVTTIHDVLDDEFVFSKNNARDYYLTFLGRQESLKFSINEVIGLHNMLDKLSHLKKDSMVWVCSFDFKNYIFQIIFNDEMVFIGGFILLINDDIGAKKKDFLKSALVASD